MLLLMVPRDCRAPQQTHLPPYPVPLMLLPEASLHYYPHHRLSSLFEAFHPGLSTFTNTFGMCSFMLSNNKLLGFKKKQLSLRIFKYITALLIFPDTNSVWAPCHRGSL